MAPSKKDPASFRAACPGTACEPCPADAGVRSPGENQFKRMSSPELDFRTKIINVLYSLTETIFRQTFPVKQLIHEKSGLL
jgi:hypothetical protein